MLVNNGMVLIVSTTGRPAYSTQARYVNFNCAQTSVMHKEEALTCIKGRQGNIRGGGCRIEELPRTYYNVRHPGGGKKD